MDDPPEAPITSLTIFINENDRTNRDCGLMKLLLEVDMIDGFTSPGVEK